MNLKELILELEKEPQDKLVKYGFGTAHSYRGYYEDLAFSPKEDTSVGEMLSIAKASIGKTFTGWKGGEFSMSEYTTVWLAEDGDCGDQITLYGLAFMLGRKKP